MNGLRSSAGRTVAFTDLWRMGPSEVVSLVGAGGKSSLMEAIARDFEAEGSRVILTTTTKIRGPHDRPLVVAPTLEALVERVTDAMTASRRCMPPDERPSPVVGCGLTPDGKVEGIPPGWVPALRDIRGVAAILVEADGSIGRPLKAPAEWEPVVPPCSSLVVSVVGLDAQGAPLDGRYVHRPELLAERLGVRPGSPVAPGDLLRAALAYEAAAPAHADFIVFLNKADEREPEPELLSACWESGWEIWSGAAAPPPAAPDASDARLPDRRLRRLDRLTGASGEGGVFPAVVLAAGLGTRMDGLKVSAPFGDSTVGGHVVRAALECSAFREVVVVAGAETEAIAEVVEAEEARRSSPPTVRPARVRVVRNAAPEEGMASSLRVGVGALHRPGGAAFLLGDQPLVTPETLARVALAAAAAPRVAAAGVVVRAGDLPRPPVVLHRSLLPRVLESRGDEGARRLIAAHAGSVVSVGIESEEIVDVDRPEDLRRARDILRARSMGAEE
jgi:probable selenium-dependent hydroxylase accessory protein YqeC